MEAQKDPVPASASQVRKLVIRNLQNTLPEKNLKRRTAGFKSLMLLKLLLPC